MAILKTAEATNADSPNVRDRNQGVLTSGDYRTLEATYEMTGTEAASGDVIDIGDIPVGAVVLAEDIRVANEADMGGSDLALPTIGDGEDADRYSATSIAVHSSNAAIQTATPNVADGIISRHVVTRATQRIKAAFTRTTEPTAGKKLKFLVPYRIG